MLTNVLIAIIRVYQALLSPVLRAAFGPSCRFQPSCSEYAVLALKGHGPIRGSLLSLGRLCKCHPFHPGGYDPPPPARNGRVHIRDARQHVGASGAITSKVGKHLDVSAGAKPSTALPDSLPASATQTPVGPQ